MLVADDVAQAGGIDCGCGVAAARLLLPSVVLQPRDALREAAARHGLACWAGHFTPRLSLSADTLLLEVGASLRLFGGLERLAGAAAEGIVEQGFRVMMAAAPTPLGAEWLAYCGAGVLCADLESMRRRLGALSVDGLPGLPARAVTALERFGLRTLAEVRRLPTADLARRIGDEAVQQIARAFGELPDLRAEFVFPERFALSLALPAPVDAAPALLFAGRRLTSALAGWLVARQAGVRAAAFVLRHRQGVSEIDLRFAEATADGGRFARVLRERLERTALAAPVEAIELVASEVVPLPGASRALFDNSVSDGETIGALLERLRARLGDGCVQRLLTPADHRPECATRRVSLLAEGEAPGRPATLPRPLWLLDPPEPLRESGGRPQHRGPLVLLGGPERIESGWWDDEAGGQSVGQAAGRSVGDIRRDYFVALAPDARWLWIYRECRPPGRWYLHGLFA